MRLPFTIEKLYSTRLSFNQIVQELENKDSIRSFGGLRIDKYNFRVEGNMIYIQRYSSGLDALLQIFPSIKAELMNENPTRIYLKLKPRYNSLIFLATFVVVFGFAGIFVDDWTINGVKRVPTVVERLGILLVGSGIPFLLCYLQIKPIKKTADWIVKKLELVEE